MVNSVRIVFIGNQDNNGYRFCKWARMLGYDTDIYMINGDYLRSMPEYVDRNLLVDGVRRYPKWIKNLENKSKMWLFFGTNVIRRIERENDIAVTFGKRGLFAANHISKIPVIHWSLGEVTDLPFQFLGKGVSFKHRIISLFARVSIMKVRKIICAYRPTIDVLKKHKLENKLLLFGYPEDVEGNRRKIDDDFLNKLNKKYSRFDKVFLWLSRVNFKNPISPEYKGTEKFLKALKNIVLKGRKNIKAVIGEHGYDINDFKKMVVDWEMQDYIDYVPHLPYWKLLTYLSIKNAVVFDTLDSQKGGLPGLARESLSLGSVLVRYLDNDLISECYGKGCPIINAYDERTCYEAMEKVLGMSDDEFEALKKRTFRWAGECLNYDKLIPKFFSLIEKEIA